MLGSTEGGELDPAVHDRDAARKILIPFYLAGEVEKSPRALEETVEI